MNSQELRALQEAYSQVYELDEDGWQPPTQKKADKMMKQASKLHRTASERGEPGNPEAEKKHTQASKIYFMSRRMSDKAKERDNEAKRKEFVKEDLYDIILSHLLDEGYADTEQAAEAIMVNMSEDWRESIMERREHDEPGEDDRNPDVRSHNRAVGYKSKPKQKYGSYDKRDRGGSEEDHEKSLGLQNLIRSVQGGSVKKSG